MTQVSLMSLAVQKADWLEARQTLLAQNVANANTPNYKAKDIEPFESYLDNAGTAMSTSNGRHLSISSSGLAAPRIKRDGIGEKSHSGNTVSLENELLKLGEANSQFALNAGLMKTFHRMIMASLKG